MKIRFKNGSCIEVIDTDQENNIRSNPEEPDMNDIDWFCDLIGVQLLAYQKFLLWLNYRNDIRRIRESICRINGLFQHDMKMKVKEDTL